MINSFIDLMITCRWFIALVVFDIIVVLTLWTLWVKFIKFIDRKYGDRIRDLIYRKPFKSPFDNSGNRPNNARPNRHPDGDCGIYLIKKVQYRFKQSIRIHLAIKRLIYKSHLGLPSHYRSHGSCDAKDHRTDEYSSYNPMHHEESVSDFSQRGQTNANRTGHPCVSTTNLLESRIRKLLKLI